MLCRRRSNHKPTLMAIRQRSADLALRVDLTSAAFALPALRCNTKLQLNIIKTHARARMACDFTVRDAMAYTNYHAVIVNENDSHMQQTSIYFKK
jgi:hypothetical protein